VTKREPLLTDAEREEVCQQILEEISTSTKGLGTICIELGTVNRRTFLRWLKTDSGLCHRYVLAREFQQELVAEEMLAIADDGSNDTYVDEEVRTRVDHDNIQRSRLRVDTRKWLMSKLAPKKYGDATKVELSGEVKSGNCETPQDVLDLLNSKLPGLVAALDAQAK